MTRALTYMFSADHSTDSGVLKIEAAREVARSANNQAREIGSPVRLRVVLSPRKGKDNENSWKYDNPQMRGARWRFEDMEHVDVYLLRRYS